MKRFKIKSEIFLGMSHCGPVTEDITVTVDFTDEEVEQLVALIQKEGTSDVNELALEDVLPTVYNKLDAAYYDAACRAENDHWRWSSYYDGCDEYDEEDLISYCEIEYGYSFDNEDEDSDGFDEEDYDNAKREHFYEWLVPFLEGLSYEERTYIFEEKMNIQIESDGEMPEYEMKLPQEIIEIAK